MDKTKIKIAAIVGPTASGKTALSVALAKKYNGEIISCDSMQIYRRMNVGTSKPTQEERHGIPHYMFDVVEPGENYSCGDYVEAAGEIIRDVSSRGKLPIICGGTGLYLDSLLRGGHFGSTETLPEYRAELEALAAEKGNEAVYSLLLAIDHDSAASIHPNNLKRVIRALEIYKSSGKTKSELDRETRGPESAYDALVIGLRFENREALYERINRRVSMMIDDGLEDEVRALIKEGVVSENGTNTASQAIGYKEMLGYIRGEDTLIDAIEEIRKATRRYAKRQMTWFSAHSDVNWIDVADDYNFDKVFSAASGMIDSFLGDRTAK